MLLMTRRRTAITFAALLTGCTALTAPTSLAAIVTDGQQVDQAFIKIAPLIATAYPALLTKAGVTLATITNGSTGWLDIAATSLSTLAAQGSPASGASTMQVVEEYFNKFMDLASSVTTAVDPTLGLEIGAASVLISTIEAVVGLPTPTAAATLNIKAREPAIVRAKALAPGMSPATARLTLAKFIATPTAEIQSRMNTALLSKPPAEVSARAPEPR